MYTCYRCEVEKPLTDFHTSKHNKSGITNICKPCQKLKNSEYYAKNKEKLKAQTKDYVVKNKEKVHLSRKRYRTENAKRLKESHARYVKNNREKINALGRKSYYLHREERIKKHSAYRKTHMDVFSRASKRWRERNPLAARASSLNRIARIKKVGGKLSKGLAKTLFTLQRGLCVCCRKPLGPTFHLDHIIPLALGGENVDGNIQLLRARCNLQKHMKHPVDFMQERGFLL